MSREVHVPFVEQRWGKFPTLTLLVILCRSHNQFKKARSKVFRILQSLKLTLSPKKSYMGPLTDFHYLGAMIKVTPSFDLCNTQISTCLHPRTMLKALNKAKVSAAFGSATHNLSFYVKHGS